MYEELFYFLEIEKTQNLELDISHDTLAGELHLYEKNDGGGETDRQRVS